ncbi:GSCFA domain-containing protein [Halobacillus litoralis]|uniref:GSCFA domain-containing protein n=1 Tax=Halobacillus litoralis TaxID=45668 RepID=UPI001CD62C56|nr:GSCFA domain-containing protein [Halobacillus litoralis]MCA0971588.1 GSCFA domain-containing protein [Halobacillus litoralis]
MKKRIDEVEKYASNSKVVLYGAGDITEELLEYLSSDAMENIIGLADISTLKNGYSMGGVKIYYPESIELLQPDYVLVNIQSLKSSKEVCIEWGQKLGVEFIDLNRICGPLSNSISLSYPYKVKNNNSDDILSLEDEPFRFYPKTENFSQGFLHSPESPSDFEIKKSSKIASMGSCFATEIKNWLKFNGYHYMESVKGQAGYAGSAAYHKVFNTYSMLQELKRAYGQFDPKDVVWEFEKDGASILKDPYRRSIAWESFDKMELELEQHKKNVTEVFSKCDFLILTVGQPEVWYNSDDGYVYSQIPPTEVFDPEKHKWKKTTYGENLDNLEEIYSLFKKMNPSGKIIISLSPVPLNATFQKKNSIIANSENKSMLRCVISDFVANHSNSVSYFPSYEIVTQLEKEPYTEDMRHVKSDTVNNIMEFFEEYYCYSKVNNSKFQTRQI